MGNIREINIKNRTYYFFDDMIKIQDFKANLLKIDKKSCRNTGIYDIGYIVNKDSKYVNIHSVNSLYFIADKVYGFTEENEGNKHLNLAFTDNNSEVLKKYAQLWNRIKNLIEKIDNKPGEYGKDYTRIKFNLDHNFPLNKPLKFYNLMIIVRSVFQEDNKYYPQVYLDECFYEL